MISKNKQNTDSYIQGQSRTNYYDSQMGGYNQSPVRKRINSKFASNKRMSQVAEKIQDVIDLCSNDRNQGFNQFQSIAHAQKGILDLLIGSDLQQANLPMNTLQGTYNNPSNLQAQMNSHFGGGPSLNKGNQTYKGSKPFIEIASMKPQNGQPSIRTQLAHNSKAIVGDEALQMIEEIQKKALLEIDHLKREKAELIRRLNQEIRLHNDQKRRRNWCENQLKRLIAFLEQNGFRVGQIQYPDWYFQTSQTTQQQPQQQQTFVYTVGGDQNTFNQTNQQRPQSPLQQQAPSFASNQPQQPFNPNQTSQNQVNPNQVSQHTAINNFSQSQLGQSVHAQRPISPNPQQIQSHYQIQGNGTYQGLQTVTNAFNQPNQMDYSQYRPQSNIQGYAYHPQTGQLVQANNYDGLRSGIQQLHNDNIGLIQRLQSNQGPQDFNTLQQRLMAAQQRARNYQRQMDRWKMQASRRGDYPGLAELLQETQKIRRQTIKLLQMKSTGQLGGNNNSYRDQSYNQRSRKVAKGSFDTNVLSPKSEYQNMLEEMKRITKN